MRPAGRLAVLVLLATFLAPVSSGCGGAKKPPKDKYEGMTAEQIYQLGAKALQNKRWGKARSILQSALGRSTSTPEVIAKVHLGLADAYYYDGGLINLAEALSRYTNFLTFYPNHERADYAQYQVGLCYLRQALSPDRDQTQTQKALVEFMKVGTQYPNSPFVGSAESKANEAREKLAEADFRIGKFYYRNRAYKGAVDRFREILETYPLYTRKANLYFLLGRSLIALDKTDEGRLYLEKLIAEYPDSKYAYTVQQILQQPAPTAEGGQ